ncbi:ABC transporter-like protein [Bacillus methanolicus PB1]|uniref:ABC transporter-like protein n=1 Tax=Bacillus methanolicus PB1 TaxID=997296 RepID=I3E6N4_BACMT|nr:ABC transporter ATP-binding protein [Bacillus methanolicus]EIJ82155.1 ABC transporter-like protein [Bacillus methanolicus PB1]
MLAIENVSRTFANGETGLKNINLTVQKGEIIGILGTSGCGKSTLLRVLSGLDEGYAGTVKIDGDIVRSVHEKIGIIFQEPRLLPWLNVIDNVAFGLKNNDQKMEIAKKYISLVGLAGFENHYPKDLSGGMAQRVAIARALVTAPEILLLDEPFSALDAFTKMQLQDLLLSIWEQYQSTMLLVTHDVDEALYLCDRIIILRGQPGEICDMLTIEQKRPRARGDAYLGQLKEKIINLLDLSTNS